MPGRFLMLVTIAAVLLTVGVVVFAFKDINGGGQASSDVASTVSRYWRVAKSKTLENVSPVLNTFGISVDKGTISAEDSRAAKYLEDAASSLNSTIKSITQ